MSRNMRGVIATKIEDGRESRYASIKEAAEAHGVSPQSIRVYCELKKTVNGYAFCYEEERGGTLTAQHAEIIMAMADNQLNQRLVAQSIGYSDGGIGYQVRQIQWITGKDPRDFWDMIELVKMAKDILQEAK